MGDAISSVVLLIGLAVGVDYSLFYLRREREERRRGASTAEAVDVAAATSGRAVLVSGPDRDRRDGRHVLRRRQHVRLVRHRLDDRRRRRDDRLDHRACPPRSRCSGEGRPRPPAVHRQAHGRAASEGGRFWRAVVDGSLRRPLLSVVLAGGLLVALAIPAFSMHTALSGTSDLPHDLPVMRVYERLQAAFPGGQIPAEVVVRANDLQSPRMRAAIAEPRAPRARRRGAVQRAGRGHGRARRHGRVDPDPDGGRRQRRHLDARAGRRARRRSSRRRSARSPAPRPTSPAWPPARRTSTT